MDIQQVMQQKFGQNILTHLLPHYQRPDIICCFDENGKPVTNEIIDCFPKPYSGKVLTKEFILSRHETFASQTDKLRMVAVVLGGWNFYIRDSRKPTGGLKLKIEQLELIGYKTVLVHFEDWLNQPREATEKLIEDEIQRVLQE
jgi:hypothetical protein